MKLWIDDVRPAPKGYICCKSVNEAKKFIAEVERVFDNYAVYYPAANGEKVKIKIDMIDIDHDAGFYVKFGGDYIQLLNWFEETGRSYPIHIHSQNPVGVENMRRIIRRNNWKEVF